MHACARRRFVSHSSVWICCRPGKAETAEGAARAGVYDEALLRRFARKRTRRNLATSIQATDSHQESLAGPHGRAMRRQTRARILHLSGMWQRLPEESEISLD